ncbi:glycosyltransferase family 2 protein [Bacillus timonensis]|nr:glycosyltransferase family 2 protein [Bacillus timonensis]
MTKPVLTIVVPCYNEEAVLGETMKQLCQFLDQMIQENMVSPSSKLLFVDDGSKDKTWPLIYRAGLDNNMIKGIKLSRNCGHQNALLAGLFAASEGSDCTVSIDADLQDDITVIRAFIEEYKRGHEIVYGVRKERSVDTPFKRLSAIGFYKIMKALGVDIIFNHADFRLMSSRAIKELQHFGEINLFLRGIVPLIGFKSTTVSYDRAERFAGETKYPLRKMLSFALDGITSFSVTPIRFISLIGFLSFIVSLLFGCYFFILKFSGHTQTGWTSLITSIWLIGGLQLIAIGFIGEYVGKIYKESKRRPRYIIDIDTYNLARPHNTNLASDHFSTDQLLEEGNR